MPAIHRPTDAICPTWADSKVWMFFDASSQKS
jgi:hypothetical protein